jgi:hypothetical protein
MPVHRPRRISCPPRSRRGHGRDGRGTETALHQIAPSAPPRTGAKRRGPSARQAGRKGAHENGAYRAPSHSLQTAWFSQSGQSTVIAPFWAPRWLVLPVQGRTFYGTPKGGRYRATRRQGFSVTSDGRLEARRPDRHASSPTPRRVEAAKQRHRAGATVVSTATEPRSHSETHFAPTAGDLTSTRQGVNAPVRRFEAHSVFSEALVLTGGPIHEPRSRGRFLNS